MLPSENKCHKLRMGGIYFSPTITIYIIKKVLLCYGICWLLLASQFWSDFLPISDLYAKIPAFYSNAFPPSYTVGCLRFWPRRAHTRCENERGEGGVKTNSN